MANACRSFYAVLRNVLSCEGDKCSVISRFFWTERWLLPKNCPNLSSRLFEMDEMKSYCNFPIGTREPWSKRRERGQISVYITCCLVTCFFSFVSQGSWSDIMGISPVKSVELKVRLGVRTPVLHLEYKSLFSWLFLQVEVSLTFSYCRTYGSC